MPISADHVEPIVPNRDASVLVDDARVAQYYTALFNDDWEVAGTLTWGSQPRLAAENEKAEQGMMRVNFAEILADD